MPDGIFLWGFIPAVFTGTWWPSRKTRLLEVFGFNSVYETQNQPSLQHNGIKMWGFSRRSVLSENQGEVWMMTSRGIWLIHNQITGQSQKEMDKHKYYIWFQDKNKNVVFALCSCKLTRLSEETSLNSCRSFPKMDLCVFLNGWMVPCKFKPYG